MTVYAGTPADISSQNVSSGLPIMFLSPNWYPDRIPQNTGYTGGLGLPNSDVPYVGELPVFRTTVTQIDWFRIAFLALGIVIGVKVLR